MRSIHLFRAFLYFYPSSFRQQFSEEMILIFEQRAGERFANRKSVSVAFFLREFWGIVKGACSMWWQGLLPGYHKPAEGQEMDLAGDPVSIAEVAKQRGTAIEKMMAAIARHDFIEARRYSYQEARLQKLGQDMELGPTA